MTDALISLLSVFVGLLILRSRGREGLNIKFKLAPFSTPQGKKDHIIVWIALGIMYLGIARYFILNSDADIVSLFVIPSLVVGLAVSLRHLKNKK